MAVSREPKGVPRGGRFATIRRGEASVMLDPGPDVSSCSSCGGSTKRSSGLCRSCDPESKKNKSKKIRSSAGSSPTRLGKSGLMYDKSAGPVRSDEIVQCGFEFVPVYRAGSQVEGQNRQCKNAVRSPAETCHKHGGNAGSSLGRSVAKASAEASRDECWPVAEEYWEGADARLETVEGQLLSMLETDTAVIAGMYTKFLSQQSTDATGRFSGMNQMLVLVQHYNDAHREGLDDDEALDRAVEMCTEPHMTAGVWGRNDRAPDDADAGGVVVRWFKPGRQILPDRKDGESDDDYRDRCKRERRFVGGGHGGHLEYRMSETEGADYEVAEAPLATWRPSGFADATATRSTLEDRAVEMGVKVRYVDQKPSAGYAYWCVDPPEIVVWNGVGGGSDAAKVHALAHELGHASLGHLTDAQSENRRPDMEVAAESFAALVCAHHGIDTSDISAHYINDWRSSAGVKMSSSGLGPLRSAASAFDDYVASVSGV